MAALLPDPPPVTFQYALPSGPVAGAAVDIGHVAVTIALLLTGNWTCSPGRRPTTRLARVRWPRSVPWPKA